MSKKYTLAKSLKTGDRIERTEGRNKDGWRIEAIRNGSRQSPFIEADIRNERAGAAKTLTFAQNDSVLKITA